MWLWRTYFVSVVHKREVREGISKRTSAIPKHRLFYAEAFSSRIHASDTVMLWASKASGASLEAYHGGLSRSARNNGLRFFVAVSNVDFSFGQRWHGAMLELRGWRAGSIRPRWRQLVVSLRWMRLGDGRTADTSSRNQSVRGSVRHVNRPIFLDGGLKRVYLSLQICSRHALRQKKKQTGTTREFIVEVAKLPRVPPFCN